MKTGKVIILRGPSGCGKSTYRRNMLDTERIVFCSSDTYFTTEEHGYVFDPAKLGEAHGHCLREFIWEVSGVGGSSPPVVVVDNTNTTIVEIAPYVAIAEAYGYEVEIHCLPYHKIEKDLAARNKHGVPEATIRKQIQRLDSTDPILKSSFPRATIVYVEAKND